MHKFRLAIVALVVVAGAGGAQTPPIITNPAPNPNAPAFRLSAQPGITVGGLNNDPRYELISITDAEVTRSGQLLVAPRVNVTGGRGRGPTTSSGVAEVRIFTTGGRFERAIGRTGQGPGEFLRVARVWPMAGDSIAVFDDNLRRVSIFDSAGAFGRTIADIAPGQCCFEDWSSLVKGQPSVAAIRGELKGRDTIKWSVLPPGSKASPRAVLMLEDGDPTARVGTGPGGRGSMGVGLPFSRRPSIGISAKEIVYGMPDAYEYRVFSQTGELTRVVRASATPVPLTRATIAAARETFGVGTPDRDAYVAAYDRAKMPATLPAYYGLLAERDGTVWVASFFDSAATRQWWARFDPTGKLLGTIAIPEGMRVVRFSNGHVILTRHDTSQGVVTVFVHRLEPI